MTDCIYWDWPLILNQFGRISQILIDIVLGILLYAVYKQGNGNGTGAKWMQWVGIYILSNAGLVLLLGFIPRSCLIPDGSIFSINDPISITGVYAILNIIGIVGIIFLSRILKEKE